MALAFAPPFFYSPPHPPWESCQRSRLSGYPYPQRLFNRSPAAQFLLCTCRGGPGHPFPILFLHPPWERRKKHRRQAVCGAETVEKLVIASIEGAWQSVIFTQERIPTAQKGLGMTDFSKKHFFDTLSTADKPSAVLIQINYFLGWIFFCSQSLPSTNRATM